MNEFIDQQEAHKEISIATAVRVAQHASAEDFEKYSKQLQVRIGEPIKKEYINSALLTIDKKEEIDEFDPRRYLPEPDAIGKLQAILGRGGK